MSTDDHDERSLYGRGDPQSDERAREHAPAGVIAGAAISFVRIDYNVSSIVTLCNASFLSKTLKTQKLL